MAERFQWNNDQPAFAQGSITFSNLQNFLLGGPVGTSATYLLPGSSTYRHERSTLFGFFAQDDWKVTPRFTLSYGLRWEFTTGVSETNGLLSHLSTSWQTATLNDLVTGSIYKNRIDQFQPRLGFNWGIDQAQKTVLSGALGIFQQPILNNYMVSFRAQLPFYSRGAFTNINAAQTFPDIHAMIASTAASGVSIGSLAAFRVNRELDYNNFKEPTIYRANLTLQRELPGQMVMQLGFVGSLGRHMGRRQAVNNWPQPIRQPDGSLFFPPAPTPQFTNPNFSMMELMSSDVNSSYNALTGSIRKRFSRGMTFQVNYTYSKCIDDSSATESNFGTSQVNQQFSPNRTLDRARCNFNPPHSFVFNGLYELPFGPGKALLSSGGVAGRLLGGWQVGGIVTIQQGLPFTVTSSASTAGYAFTANRPNVNPGVDINKATQGAFGNRRQFFDTSIFYVPPSGTIGNADRNLLLGPPLVTSNLSINRLFSIRERTKLEFRAEFFNAINQTSLGFPAPQVFSSFAISPITGKTAITPGAGLITTTTTTAREIQFGLKLMF
jgi:hypothetical protein